jgi:tyrosine-specific transport protein
LQVEVPIGYSSPFLMNSIAEQESHRGGVFGATLLVTGTAIGAGMLALPVITSASGFLPSVIVYLLCWLLMAGTGLLFLELTLWMDKETNIISMTGRVLGRPGKIFAWVVYLYLFYSLTVAYISGSGQIVADMSNGAISAWLGTLLFVLIFSPWVYVGARAVDRTNIVMMVGLGLAYIAFVALGAPHVNHRLLARRDWSELLAGLPVVITSFGYQGMVPSLTAYLSRHAKQVRLAIIVGSFIPFVIYVIWQFLILGIVPYRGEYGLEKTLNQGGNAVQPLRYALSTPWLHIVGEFFAFFALTSSFLGVSLGLRDFLADGLGVGRGPSGRLWLCLLIFLPALLISWSNPKLFLLALQYGGGLGVTLLLGLLPVVLVWVGRYQMKIESPYRVTGGRWLLSLLAIGFLLVLCTEIWPF